MTEEIITEQPVAEPTRAVVRLEPDLQNVTLVATSPEAVPHLQAELLGWVRLKVKRVRAELREAQEALKHAGEHKWATGTLRKLTARLLQFAIYYGKIQSALEAGYCLFPNTDAAIFSVRVNTKRPGSFGSYERWHGRLDRLEGKPLEEGVGRYVGVQPSIATDVHTVTNQHTGKKEDKIWFRRDEFQEVPFPLMACKPELMNVTASAMEKRFFDELGLAGVRSVRDRGDPVVVGRILGPSNGYGGHRRVTFLIGWFVNTRDL